MTARVVLLSLLVPIIAGAQPQPPLPPRFGPWDNDLILARSTDGITFSRPAPFVERGGVPHVVRDAKNRLVAVFQWFPFDKPLAFDRVAVCVSEDHGKTWSAPEPVVVNGLPDGYARPFDPTLVLLDDGRLRLYFTSHRPDRRTPAIYSAVGSGGIEYDFERGERLAVDGEVVIDCAAARLGKTWHLYAPVQSAAGEAYHAVSDDGVAFQRVDNVTIRDDEQRDLRWLGCALAIDGTLRFYGTARGGIWSATSKDGVKWMLQPPVRGGGGADPGVC